MLYLEVYTMALTFLPRALKGAPRIIQFSRYIVCLSLCPARDNGLSFTHSNGNAVSVER